MTQSCRLILLENELIMLELKSISVEIQNSPILRKISLDIKAGELVCLVGRNGAGKTTTLNSIMGYLKPNAGDILLEGKTILGKRTFDIARLGIGFAPEESEVLVTSQLPRILKCQLGRLKQNYLMKSVLPWPTVFFRS